MIKAKRARKWYVGKIGIYLLLEAEININYLLELEKCKPTQQNTVFKKKLRSLKMKRSFAYRLIFKLLQHISSCYSNWKFGVKIGAPPMRKDW